MIVLTLTRRLLAAADRILAGLARYRAIAEAAERTRDAAALRRRLGLDV